jgi:hypothetical protein
MRALMFVVFLVPAAASAGDVTGVWEISSLGGDRRVEVWHDGDEVTAYRVLYPEFEGERYKLEHLFRGRVSGSTIEGEIMVKEEGMRAFDPLRSFRGRIEKNGTITLDGLPMKRTGEKLTSKPPKTRKKKRRVRRGPKMSFVVLSMREVA